MMKAKRNIAKAMTATFTLAATAILLLSTAAPAAAGGLSLSGLHLSDTGKQHMDIASLADQLAAHQAEEADESDDAVLDFVLVGPMHAVPMNPIGDGGDWEMVEPEPTVPGDAGDEDVVPDDSEPSDEAPGDAGDEEVVPDDCAPEDGADDAEQPADDTQDQEDEPGDAVPDDGADEADEPADEPQPEQPAQEQTPDEQPTLPFTGGDNTPYLIAGAALALFGITTLRRRRADSERD